MTQRTSQGARLRAARISAGYATASEAARQLDFHTRTYAVAELRGPSFDLASKAQWIFGVSHEFLNDGWVVGATDEFARRVVKLLARYDDEGYAPDLPVRLRRMRMEFVNRTATSAAAEHDWARSTYAQHENGTRPVPPETAISYALRYSWRPEFLLFAEPPERDEAWAMSSKQRVGLRAGKGLDDSFVLRLVEEEAGRLVDVGTMPLVGPKRLFPLLTLDEGRFLVGLIRRDFRDEANEVWIVRSGEAVGDNIVVSSQGTVRVVNGVQAGQFTRTFSDPTAQSKPYVLGTRIAILQMQALRL